MLTFSIGVLIGAGVGLFTGHIKGYLAGKNETCHNCPVKSGEPSWFR